MNIIDENFIDVCIYSVNFYCNNYKKEYQREIIVPTYWDEDQLNSTISKIFNESKEIKRINFVMDAWVPKDINSFKNEL